MKRINAHWQVYINEAGRTNIGRLGVWHNTLIGSSFYSHNIQVACLFSSPAQRHPRLSSMNSYPQSNSLNWSTSSQILTPTTSTIPHREHWSVKVPHLAWSPIKASGFLCSFLFSIRYYGKQHWMDSSKYVATPTGGDTQRKQSLYVLQTFQTLQQDA